ncbi:MAG: hypothetical protein LAN71_17125 [Acidobacteriia bacterium]|nr:hypothetical protein [Terriglobia bacterium]
MVLVTTKDYEEGLRPIVPWLIYQIDKSKDKFIVVRLKDVQNEIAKSKRELLDKTSIVFYMVLKRLLFRYGIYTELYKKEYLYISRKKSDIVNKLVVVGVKTEPKKILQVVGQSKLKLPDINALNTKKEKYKPVEQTPNSINVNPSPVVRTKNFVSIITNEEREKEEEELRKTERIRKIKEEEEELRKTERIRKIKEEEEEELRKTERIRKIKEEEEEELRKEKDLLTYRDKIKEILPSMKKELELHDNTYIRMDNMRKVLGKDFNIYEDKTIYLNIRNEMETYNIRVDIYYEYLKFRYFFWEKQGFSSKKGYEEYLGSNRNCEIIRKIAKDCMEKYPESLFNIKELIKNIFSACIIGDTIVEEDAYVFLEQLKIDDEKRRLNLTFENLKDNEEKRRLKLLEEMKNVNIRSKLTEWYKTYFR